MKDRYFELKNLIGAILLLSVVVWGCQKGDQTLGVNLLPGVKIYETRYHQEKSTITTAIFTDTKIRVDRPVYNLLGSFNDPVFGRTDASFAAQYRISIFNPDYTASSSLDSIVLRMTYKKMYGDTISTQTLKVYELTGSLNYDAIYLSSFNLKSLASIVPIGTTSYIPKFRTDSLKTDTTIQYVSVRLNPSFGNRLLHIDSLDMTSNDKFLNVFKGLYISSDPVSRKGSLVSIDASAITMYYHDPAKLNNDTLYFNYIMTQNAAKISSYVHDYSTARFFPNLDKEDNADTLVYIQPTGGIKAKILVPSLSLWKDSVKYAINKATLTFHVDTIMSDYRRYSMPPRLYLKIITDTGTEEFPADSQLSSAYYGGFFDYTTATYSFNVTQHLQQLIDGVKADGTPIHNNGFYLVQSERNTSAERVILKGQGSSKPVELNISYTRYKE